MKTFLKNEIKELRIQKVTNFQASKFNLLILSIAKLKRIYYKTRSPLLSPTTSTSTDVYNERRETVHVKRKRERETERDRDRGDPNEKRGRQVHCRKRRKDKCMT